MYKTKTSKVYKDKTLNAADFGDFNLNNYQVFLHLISNLGGIDEFGKYLQPEELQREHVLSAKEFSQTFNTDIRSSYSYLKKAVDKLVKADIRIDTSKEITRINVCSQAKYNKNKGSITVKFTDDIMPYLAQVKEKFILYNLKEVADFRSIYTARLYELIQGYKETGWILVSIDQLKHSFAVNNKFKLYTDFKRRTFGHACKEINKIYNLDLRFEEIKEGRKVVAVKFFFNKTKIHKAINQKTGKAVNIYEKPKLKSNKILQNKQKNTTEVLEGQMAFSDFSQSDKNLESVLKELSTHLEKGKK